MGSYTAIVEFVHHCRILSKGRRLLCVLLRERRLEYLWINLGAWWEIEPSHFLSQAMTWCWWPVCSLVTFPPHTLVWCPFCLYWSERWIPPLLVDHPDHSLACQTSSLGRPSSICPVCCSGSLPTSASASAVEGHGLREMRWFCCRRLLKIMNESAITDINGCRATVREYSCEGNVPCSA